MRAGAVHGLERRSGIAVLAAAGIAGPVVFAVVALVQSLVRPEHSLVAHPISALAAGPDGWVQDVNFLLFGSLMIAYAVGLHLGVRPSRAGVVGFAFLVLSGPQLNFVDGFSSLCDKVLHRVLILFHPARPVLSVKVFPNGTT